MYFVYQEKQVTFTINDWHLKNRHWLDFTVKTTWFPWNGKKYLLNVSADVYFVNLSWLKIQDIEAKQMVGFHLFKTIYTC